MRTWKPQTPPRQLQPLSRPQQARECWQRGASKPSSARWAKPQCQFLVGIEEEPVFQVKRKLLGPHGQHMKAIAEKSGAKLRLRGRGSGFLEGPAQQESSDPLMLCVSAPDTWTYREATRMVKQLLGRVYGEFRHFCEGSGRQAPSLHIEMHEGPRPGSF
mmetsp:Transcript_58861/g.137043  ORF Transcript_58861/g.137043 Transcript_58861/m.137043 type:complete len:160 (+) Transcript_58861:220-699(+)